MLLVVERSLSAKLLLPDTAGRVVIDSSRIGARRSIAESAAEAARSARGIVAVRNGMTRRKSL